TRFSRDWSSDVCSSDLEGGDLDQAISWYKTALQRQDNAEIRIGLGDAYRKTSGGGGVAMDNYETVATKDPNNSLAHSRVGSLWRSEERRVGRECRSRAR